MCMPSFGCDACRMIETVARWFRSERLSGSMGFTYAQCICRRCKQLKEKMKN